jgi:hypothetical protein
MMIATCIQKFKANSGKITGYALNCGNNNLTFASDELKRAIKSGEIYVNNLQLTSDGRLVDKANDYEKLATQALQYFTNNLKLKYNNQDIVTTPNNYYITLLGIKSKYLPDYDTMRIGICVEDFTGSVKSVQTNHIEDFLIGDALLLVLLYNSSNSRCINGVNSIDPSLINSYVLQTIYTANYDEISKVMKNFCSKTVKHLKTTKRGADYNYGANYDFTKLMGTK